MAEQIASAYVKVGANVNDYNRAMDGVNQRLQGFAKMAQGFGNALGTAVKVGAAAAGIAIVGVGAVVGKAGMEFNAMQEQAEIAFETMLGSAEKARAFLNEMQAFAKKTPFEYPDLLTASRRLMALGFASEEVLPLLTNIGDATAAMGGDSQMVDRLTTALGQMRAKGKVQAEEMMQLTENGIAAWDMLANKLGVDVATAMDMVTKRQVDAATGIAAIQAGISSDFGGMMQKQSTTWSGLISNLKDSFGMLSGRVMKPFFNMAKGGLEQLVELIGSNEFIAGVDKFTSGIVNGLNNVISGLQRFAAEYWVELKILTSDTTSFGEKLIAVWDMVYSVALKIWRSLASQLAALLPQWLEGLGKWATAIWQWIVDNTPEALRKLGEWAGKLWGWIVENAPEWAKALWNWAVETWEWIVEATPEAITQLGKWGEQLWNWLSTNLPTWVTELGKWAEAAWKWIADVIPIVATKVSEWGSTFLNWVAENSPTWQAKLAEWGRQAWAWLADVAVPKVLEYIQKWGGNLFTWLGQNLPNFVTTLLGWATALVNWIGEAAPKAINALASFVQGLRGEGDNTGANQIGQMVRNWAIKLWDWIVNDAMPKIGPAILEFANALWTAGGNILIALGNLAAEMAPTLWEWITVATPIVFSTLWDWGTKVWGWFVEKWPQLQNALYYWGVVLWEFIQRATPIVLEKLREWGGKIWAWVTENAPEWSKRLGEWATVIWAWVKEQAPKWGEKLMEWAGYAWDWLVGENGVIWAVGAKLGEWTTEISEWLGSEENQKKWSETLWGWVDIAWEWLTGENGVIWLVGTKLGEWATAIYQWLSNPENRSEWVGTLTDWATDAWTWIRDEVIPNTVTQLQEWAKAFTAPGQPGHDITTWLKTTLPVSVDAAVIAMGILQSSWNLMTDAVTGTGRDYTTFFQALKYTFDAGLGYLLVKVSTDLANLALGFFAAKSAIQGDWESMWAALDKIAGNAEVLNEQKMKLQLGLMATVWTAGGQDVVEGFGKGIDKGTTEAKGAMSSFAGDMKNSFTKPLEIYSPSRVFEGYGKNTVEGFEKGFDSKWRTFKESSQTTVNGWKAWFRGIFGISSPSTVFEGYGTNIVQGLAKGINGAGGLVTDAMGGLSAGMTTNLAYGYQPPTQGQDADMLLMQENNMLLRQLIMTLANKNMSVTVNNGSGGTSYGALVAHTAGMR